MSAAQAAHVTAVLTPGQPGYMAPGSPAWSRTITPSKMAAICGYSRWESPYRLWHRMQGLTSAEPPADRFDAGHDAEPYAANRWRRRNPGWRLSPGEVQFHAHPDHFGFPAVATLDRRASSGQSRRVVEFKIANDLYEWGDPNLDQDLADDYLTQHLGQMLITGWTEHPAHLLALGPRWGFERLYETRFDASLAAHIIGRCLAFWQSLAGGQPPLLDDTVATYECVREQHPDIDDGAVADIPADVAVAYLTSKTDAKAIEAAERGAKTALLAAMGSAQHADVAGVRVATRRKSSRGGVALYASKAHPDDIPTPEGHPA